MHSVYHKIRVTRTITAIVVICLTTLAFCDFALGLSPVGRTLASMQFIPALFSLSAAWTLTWLAVAFLFGRIYCSTFCPMGIFMDICSRLSRGRKGSPRKRYHHTAPRNTLRFTILATAGMAAAIGFPLLLVMLDPLSSYGRGVTFTLEPLTLVLSGHSDKAMLMFGSSAVAAVIAVAVMVAVALVAMRSGRTICNTICPVGTTFAIPSAYALMHMDINTDLCTNCYHCVHVCKAHCIDLSSHLIDSSRCVVCFDCADECPAHAISYRQGSHRLGLPLIERVMARRPQIVKLPEASTENESAPEGRLPLDRRTFLATGVVAAATIATARAQSSISGIRKAAHEAMHPVNWPAPPGISSFAAFLDHCTACGACIAACPSKVIKFSSTQYGITHPMRPVLDYDKAWCLADCVRCTHRCPTGALKPLSPDEKKLKPIGRARIFPENCFVWTGQSRCLACKHVCPADAISLNRSTPGRVGPEVDHEACIGCGACQNVCPAPDKAIFVDGQR